jgi:hypothetical protein
MTAQHRVDSTIKSVATIAVAAVCGTVAGILLPYAVAIVGSVFGWEARTDNILGGMEIGAFVGLCGGMSWGVIRVFRRWKQRTVSPRAEQVREGTS